MGRTLRVHIPGGTYYVVQQGNSIRPLFYQAEDYSRFEKLLAQRLYLTGARVHGYCWLPQSLHLILQIEEVPVGRLMQGLTSRYARAIHREAGETGHFFPRRYRAALIEPEEYLPSLLVYLHHLPILQGLADELSATSNTSHSAYTGESTNSWLTTQMTLQILQQKRHADPDYAEYARRGPSPDAAKLFARVGSNDFLVMGTKEFMKSLPWRTRTHQTQTSLDQIIHTVTCRLAVDRDQVLSRSRTRDCALARALIAWYAQERGVATLNAVAQRMGRDPSTLSVAIRQHRINRPDLFKLTSMHDISPLVPIDRLPRTHYWETGREY